MEQNGEHVERRLIVEQFDPERPEPGGIDTCIRDLVKYCPAEISLRIVGVDVFGNKKLGQWAQYEIGGNVVEFMPVARVDHADLDRRIPHSARVAWGLRKYHPGRDSDVVQTHRVNTGAAALRLYPQAGHVQFLHHGGITDIKKGGRSFFQHAGFVYDRLESYVIKRSVDTVVFNQPGGERLQAISSTVRFSPTWFDPKVFFPPEEERGEKTRILWACRIEPQKHPELAIDVMSALPEKYSLTVAGSGGLETMMRRRAEKSTAAERIRFVGAVQKSEIGEFMRSHDLMLMTSRHEGFSRAIVEGLASGLPVVTTPGGEPNGLVREGVNGARVASDRPDLFPAAMEVAAKVSASAARESVAHLSATARVPDVLTIPD
jgi:glycosyltransferase involved in cell wall biosynthesis